MNARRGMIFQCNNVFLRCFLYKPSEITTDRVELPRPRAVSLHLFSLSSVENSSIGRTKQSPTVFVVSSKKKPKHYWIPKKRIKRRGKKRENPLTGPRFPWKRENNENTGTRLARSLNASNVCTPTILCIILVGRKRSISLSLSPSRPLRGNNRSKRWQKSGILF